MVALSSLSVIFFSSSSSLLSNAVAPCLTSSVHTLSWLYFIGSTFGLSALSIDPVPLHTGQVVGPLCLESTHRFPSHPGQSMI